MRTTLRTHGWWLLMGTLVLPPAAGFASSRFQVKPAILKSAAPKAAGARRPAPVVTTGRKTSSGPVIHPAVLVVTQLSILPGSIHLDGPNDSSRFMVMGTLPDGSVVDVTDKAAITCSAPKLFVVDGQQISARADGEAMVMARYGGKAAPASVAAKNVTRPVFYSFQNDVVPVMARVGCSQGSCHGANSGKGGFKLSLRGYAPEMDFLAITRQSGGRRISREAPENSLFLRKPLIEVPHAGGRVVQKGSKEYDILLGWLQEGAPGPDEKEPKIVSLAALPGDRIYHPNERQRVMIRATFSDGRTQDVTDRAVFRTNDAGVAAVSPEGEITAQAPGSTAVQAKYMGQLAVVRVTIPYPQKVDPAAYKEQNNFVDAAVYKRLQELNLEPGALCTDEEFLRRVYIDALGTLPTADEAREFLASHDSDRRSKLIDAVLKRPEYASIWALKLSDLFMVRKEHMQRKNTVAFNQWLTEQFQQNRPWDKLVSDLVTASGSITEKPQTLWWASRQSSRPNAHGWVRHYELTGEITAQVFLGQRIQCAKCHNHPTEKYTQDNYYKFAAIFAQVNGDGPADPVPARFLANDPGEVRSPRTNAVEPPEPLDNTDLRVAPGEDRRVKFAQWLTGVGSGYFSRNIANRIWARLFGTGIVDPVDDLRSTNPPKNEVLLDALARDLIAHQYDLKYLMGAIMRSRTYQSSSRPTPLNRADSQFFSHYTVHRIPAEEMMDAIAEVTNVPDKFASYPLGTRAIELSDPELTSLTLDTFGRPNRTTPCECDRGSAPTLSQALDLFNGAGLQAKLKNPDGVVAHLLKSKMTDPEIVEELFLRALARHPTPDELANTLKIIAQSPTHDEGVQDMLWALVNTKEFMFNH